MEFSGEAVDDYNVLLSKKLSNEMIMKELDFQKNHPDKMVDLVRYLLPTFMLESLLRSFVVRIILCNSICIRLEK